MAIAVFIFLENVLTQRSHLYLKIYSFRVIIACCLSVTVFKDSNLTSVIKKTISLIDNEGENKE